MDESLKQDSQMSDPLMTDDIASVVPEATRVFQPSVTDASPITGDPASFSSDHPKPHGRRHFGTVLFVILLFGLGIWLSNQIRSFFAPAVSDEIALPTKFPESADNSIADLSASPSGKIPSSRGQTMEVMSGVTKKAIPGISYQLPGGILAPSCDSASCASQGTNLPGGTRFTVAPRGKGQLLPDFRGAILTDAAGREFAMKQITIGAVQAYEYTGNFTGRTGGGYTFTAIRGVLMPVTDTLAIDFNHFAPAGSVTDFSKDEVLFNEVVASFRGGPGGSN